MNGKKIANNIRAERSRKNLTIEDISFKLGVSRQTYATYEKNADNIKAHLLLKLSNILQCDIADFFIQK